MLITEGYRALQQELHQNARYGAASMKFAPTVQVLIDKHHPATLLDYGAGKRLLRTAITGVVVDEYDPGIPDIATTPQRAADMLCCIDVLEHIEPDCLDYVLADIARLTGRFAFLTIHTGPAGKFLGDGRNAHLIQRPIDWWEAKLHPHFFMLYVGRVSATTYSVEAWKK